MAFLLHNVISRRDATQFDYIGGGEKKKIVSYYFERQDYSVSKIGKP